MDQTPDIDMTGKIDRVKRNDFFAGLPLRITDVILLNGSLFLFMLLSNVATYGYLESNWLKYEIYNSWIIMIFDFILISMYINYRIKSTEFLGLKRPLLGRRGNLIVGIISSGASLFCLLIIIIGKYERLLLDKSVVQYGEDAGFLYASLYLGVHFIAPIYEELLFRGLVYPPLRNTFGVVPGIILSSAIFTFWHANVGVEKMVSIFLSGILFVYLYEMSLSLIPCVIVHFVLNLVSTVPPVLYMFLSAENYNPEIITKVMAVAFILLSMGCFFSFYIQGPDRIRQETVEITPLDKGDSA